MINREKGALPSRWRYVPLKEVCMVNARRPVLECDDSEPTTFVPMAAIDERSGTIARPEIKPFGSVSKGYTYFEDGDVLFSKITPCMQNGKHAVAVSYTAASVSARQNFMFSDPAANSARTGFMRIFGNRRSWNSPSRILLEVWVSSEFPLHFSRSLSFRWHRSLTKNASCESSSPGCCRSTGCGKRWRLS
jgi:hypothetical protein